MTQSTKPGGTSTSQARARLLATATRIFYAEGIHSVGVDRIIAEAQVTRATLYRHFKGKEDLVLAYLDLADREMRAQAEAAQAGAESAADKVRAVCRAITAGIQSPGFRGCAFLNAAAEYPDREHPVHRAVLTHRQWFLETVTELLAKTGEGPAEPAGRHLVMLRDGAMASGCLADPVLVSETFLEGVEGILLARAA
ncbi:helix-turn-helix domain-containing protein [Streptomyces sp. NPDC046939]|uniref:TetR/AcrR family transcriptional regulator n=1 Tax=Streptomyces sp. NPDC046939 TaxID=3155376 RepID=UPI00340D0010